MAVLSAARRVPPRFLRTAARIAQSSGRRRSGVASAVVVVPEGMAPGVEPVASPVVPAAFPPPPEDAAASLARAILGE